MENVGKFHVHLVILWWFGILPPLWYIIPTTIWQPWSGAKKGWNFIFRIIARYLFPRFPAQTLLPKFGRKLKLFMKRSVSPENRWVLSQKFPVKIVAKDISNTADANFYWILWKTIHLSLEFLHWEPPGRVTRLGEI
jgi:hypothetical protein